MVQVDLKENNIPEKANFLHMIAPVHPGPAKYSGQAGGNSRLGLCQYSINMYLRPEGLRPEQTRPHLDFPLSRLFMGSVYSMDSLKQTLPWLCLSPVAQAHDGQPKPMMCSSSHLLHVISLSFYIIQKYIPFVGFLQWGSSVSWDFDVHLHKDAKQCYDAIKLYYSLCWSMTTLG